MDVLVRAARGARPDAFGAATSDAPGSLRLRILYVDGDPIPTTDGIRAAYGVLVPAEIDQPEVLFSSPLKTIVPGRDW